MIKFAIWKDHKVIRYIDLTEEQRQTLNGTQGIDVYFGYDRFLRPDLYNDTNTKQEEITQ